MLKADRALVLAPHTDDGELGCGGTMARLIEQGTIVYYAAFSICEASVPEGWPRDILATEVKKAVRVLGMDADRLLIYRYPVRHFPRHRQEILEDLIQLRRQIEPDLILLPSSDDVHQDHEVICREGLRAFKQKTILGYELPWNNLTFTATSLVHLEERHVLKKIEALREYESQRHRRYQSDDLVTGLARLRGVQAGAEYAEAFQVLRWVIE